MGQSITIDFIAKTNRAISDVNRLNKAVGSNATTAQKVGAGIRKAAIPATAALVGLAAGAKVAVDAAADMNESLSKTEVLFGSAAGDIKAWSKTTAQAFGISRKSALDAAGTFATFGKSAGLTGKQLGTFSKDFTGLAADMASFNNTTPEQAIEAIGAALRGESEPIRSYGVLLDDATLRNEALKLGLISTTKEALTPQQKVLAAQKAILKQTSDAQGDYARTSDSLSNRQKALTAQVEDLKANLGQALVPVMQVVIGVLQRMATWVRENETIAKILIATVALLAAGIVAANIAMKAYKAVLVAAKVAQVALNIALTANPIGIVVVAIAALAAGIVIAYKKSQTFRNIVESIWSWVKKAAAVFEGPAKAALKVLGFAFEALTAPIRAVVSLLEKAVGLWNKFKSVVGRIPGLGSIIGRDGRSSIPMPKINSARLFQNTGPQARITPTEAVTQAQQPVVSDELLARALRRLILQSDARNGQALYI